MITENYIEVNSLCCLDTGEIVDVSAIIDALRKLGVEPVPVKCETQKHNFNTAQVVGDGITHISSVVRFNKTTAQFPVDGSDNNLIQVSFDCIFEYDPTAMMNTTASDNTTKIAKTDIKISGFGTGGFVLDNVHLDCVVDGIDFLPRCLVNTLPAMTNNMALTFEQQAVGTFRSGRAILSGYFFAPDGTFGNGVVYP